MRRRVLPWVLPAFAVLGAGCELTEVTVPEGEPRLIVQAVLSAREAEQFVIVERSLTGAVRVDTTADAVPPGEPRLPIDDAVVVLTHEGPSPCATPVDTLAVRAPGSGLYVTGTFCPLATGDRVSLRVTAPDGVVTGSTLIPGARTVSVRLGQDAPAVEGDTITLRQTADTLRIAVEGLLARAMQVEVRWLGEPDSLELYIVTDSLGVAFPGDLFNPFEGDSGRAVFEPGRDYTLAVAVTDSNYYDFVRSASDPFTGRGFLNRLDGGIGVFGSVAAYRYVLRVVP